MSRIRHFFYELACWAVILGVLVLFWYGFGQDISGERREPMIFYSEQ